MRKIHRIIIFLFLFALPLSNTFAASFSLIPNQEEIAVTREITFEIEINTQGESINAIEGKIILPREFFLLKDINSGNSIINLWVESPYLVTSASPENYVIAFAGITPGGYVGQKGKIFSLILKTLKDGRGTINFSDLRALLNDGKATPAQINAEPFAFVINAKSNQEIFEGKIETEKDVIPPESFTPVIRDELSFVSNQPVILFQTTDKQSGMAYYEIKEGEGPFLKAESPYKIKTATPQIIVRAVDKAGNIKEETLNISIPPPKSKIYPNLWKISLGASLLILILLIINILPKKRRKKRRVRTL